MSDKCKFLFWLAAFIAFIFIVWSMQPDREAELEQAKQDRPLTLDFKTRVLNDSIVVGSQGLRVRGASGRVYKNLPFSRLPTVSLVTPDGNEAVLGSFEYG